VKLKNAKDLVYALQLEQLDRYDDGSKKFVPSGHWRWIEYVGWLIHADFEPDTVTGRKRIELQSPMGGVDVLRNAIGPIKNKQDAMRLKNRLNSEIVIFREPENWSPIWVETYNMTHTDQIDASAWQELSNILS